MRGKLSDRIKVDDNNKHVKFNQIMRGQVPKADVNFVYKNIHEMYEKRENDDLKDEQTWTSTTSVTNKTPT